MSGGIVLTNLKQNFLKLFVVIAVTVSLTSCASLQSVSMTSFPKNRSKVVKAQVEKFVFLAFNFNNDFILDLIPQLQNQCPNGKVTGITSKYETRWYVIGYKMIVTSQGFCLKR